MSAPGPYHHGDLRRALVSAAVELLASTTAAELSLREVARRAGVTTGAPYHHFKTKADLLVEVACAGFEQLTPELERVDGSPAAPAERLQRRIEVYIAFALAHGAHYRVMFAPELRAASALDRYQETARAAFERLADAVRAMRTDLKRAAVDALARTIWAAAHGFIHLALDGALDALDEPPGRDVSTRSAARKMARHLVALVAVA